MTSKETAKKIEGATTGGASNSAVSCGGSGSKEIKVKFKYRLLVFSGAVIALSWFFEGTRQIAESLSFASVGILVAGTVSTALFLGVYAYWIYLEEKSKGTLNKSIPLFDKIYESRQSKLSQQTTESIREGD
jgi:hypothetical protein